MDNKTTKHTYYSGCSYNVNTGKNRYEPPGTALSTHECGDCERLSYCKVKKRVALWEHNDAIAKQMEESLMESMGISQNSGRDEEVDIVSSENKKPLHRTIDKLHMEESLMASMGMLQCSKCDEEAGIVSAESMKTPYRTTDRLHMEESLMASMGMLQCSEDNEEADAISPGNMKFSYTMLDRLRSDCAYYLGAGGRNPDRLWAKNEASHIKHMKELWNSFAETEKPYWLTWEQILAYEAEMAPIRQQATMTLDYYIRVHVFERDAEDDDLIRVRVSNGETMQEVERAIHRMADEIFFDSDTDIDDRLDELIRVVENKYGWKMDYCPMMETLEITYC